MDRAAGHRWPATQPPQIPQAWHVGARLPRIDPRPPSAFSSNFSIDVLFIHEEEIRRHDPTRAWRRRGWVTHERHLLQVVGQHLLATPADVSALLPATLPDPFTTADLAAALAQPRRLAQETVYCLHQMNTITPAGKRGNTILYTRRE